jgi:hypothetical protein
MLPEIKFVCGIKIFAQLSILYSCVPTILCLSQNKFLLNIINNIMMGNLSLWISLNAQLSGL